MASLGKFGVSITLRCQGLSSCAPRRSKRSRACERHLGGVLSSHGTPRFFADLLHDPRLRGLRNKTLYRLRTGLSSRRTRSYSQNSLISFAKTCLLTQPEFWMRDARPGHKTSGLRLRAKMLPFNVASWITPWGGRARSVEGVVDRAIELT